MVKIFSATVKPRIGLVTSGDQLNFLFFWDTSGAIKPGRGVAMTFKLLGKEDHDVYNILAEFEQNCIKTSGVWARQKRD